VTGVAVPTRWVSDTDAGHSQWYVERFRALAAEGADLAGEARLVDAMVRRGARILDAGCGQGRVSGALHARGHSVVGVDADPVLVEAARTDYPGPVWLVADLAELDLPSQGVGEPFDAVVSAGNVLPYLAPGTEREVLRRLSAHLVPDGFAVVGFGTTRGYALQAFDEDAAVAGLTVENQFATWDLRPWVDGSDFAVTVLRKPA
jgi:2-polyprenyl-3-methyl-5-hydroxy-6-metoxy-1,4-benzoquinol methylase